ncbi:MAG: bifunctional riboflavin kinase/FAD synthetase [Bacteroidia bacterium]|nr:bifunctional riboflavin kinase/FAD synthetase [Bacteroidia bacterium]MDW8301450.1 bifunctional riboflavin kinase/FAD synthetase [Bacteroidia bacterium]
MEIIHQKHFSVNFTQPLVVTLGVYDGVHIGHQHVLRTLTQYTQQIGGKSLLLTFYPHPRKVLYPDQPLFLLNTLEERLEKLKKQGLDYIWVYPFDQEFANQTAVEFVKNFIVKILKAHTIFVGYDHKFGKNREGGYALFEKLGREYHFKVVEIPAYQIDQVNVSSTKIRSALYDGDILTANNFLGYEYSLSGTVIKGKQIGRRIGFPTANIALFSREKLIPKSGVYVSKVKVNHHIWYGITNIGYKPTVEESNELHIEIHIFDFSDDIYGEVLEVFPLRYIRNEQKFESIDALCKQIQQDKNTALEYLRTMNLS